MQTIYIDISNKGMIQPVYAKQGDIGRKFVAVFMENGGRYNIPSGSMFSAWYKGSSGEGNYTDVGEKSAFSIANNRVIVELISEMLGVPGEGFICLVLTKSDGGQIGSWNIPYICEEVPGFGSEEVTQYFTAFSKALEDIRSNPENIIIDNTLSNIGDAADAGAVGEKLRPLDGNFNLEWEIGNIEQPDASTLTYPSSNYVIRTKANCLYFVPGGSTITFTDFNYSEKADPKVYVFYSYDGGSTYLCELRNKANPSPVSIPYDALVAIKIRQEEYHLGQNADKIPGILDLLTADIYTVNDRLANLDNAISVTNANVVAAISGVTEINSPSKVIDDSGADFDTTTETGDYTVTARNVANNPLSGLFKNDTCKLYVRKDRYNRCTQIVHPLYESSYGYGMPARMFFRIGAKANTSNRVWGGWMEILTSSSNGWATGKTIVNIGDSIFGNYDFASISQYLTQFSGATVHNCGFGGTGVVPRGDSFAPFDFGNLYTAICTGDWSTQEAQIGADGIPEIYATRLETIKSVDFSAVDVLTIAYGTNDWAAGSNTIADVVSTLEASIKQINRTYPQMKIVLICPIWRLWNGEDSDVKSYGTGTLEEFSVEYEKLAKKLKIPYLDAYHNLTFNNDNRAVFYAETGESSTHLNETGRKVYAELLDGKLKTLF